MGYRALGSIFQTSQQALEAVIHEWITGGGRDHHDDILATLEDDTDTDLIAEMIEHGVVKVVSIKAGDFTAGVTVAGVRIDGREVPLIHSASDLDAAVAAVRERLTRRLTAATPGKAIVASELLDALYRRDVL